MSLTDEDKQWIDESLTASGDRIMEAIRGLLAETLRRLNAHSDSLAIRLRKIETDQSNLDISLSKRVEILEQRLLEIETKLDHTR